MTRTIPTTPHRQHVAGAVSASLVSASSVSSVSLSDRVAYDPPVVLAPMAGITNAPFRRLCREWMATQLRPGQSGGLFVCEMITSRALVEGNDKTMKLIAFGPDESPRSLQLYGVDPEVVAQAVRMIVEQDLADHVDLNFGCPVPKVTRKGGGAALPWHLDLFTDIVNGAVRAAQGAVPVTVKIRIGIDEDHHTFREAGLRAQDAGVAHVALHGRTAQQFYSGQADWDAIAELVELLDIPVLGNGDIWEGEDAVEMMAHTGCAGVVVGRGCLGRPWLFADLAAALNAHASCTRPTLGQVGAAMARHARLLVDWAGSEHGVIEFRKHVAWYLKGYPVGRGLRAALATSSSLAELEDHLARLDASEPFPDSLRGLPRGRTSQQKSVALPEGWLADRASRAVPAGAESDDSGG